MLSVLARAICTAAAAMFASAALAAQPAANGPRTKEGKPDLNGIWQVMNTANFDLEPHAARC